MAAMAKRYETASAPGTLVVGLGGTGLSVARFLSARGLGYAVADSRPSPPGLESLRREFPEVEPFLGPFDTALFMQAAQIILSPGISPAQPAVAAARASGVPVIGDIELFCRHARAPIIAITGSNGKSTVTTLVGRMATEAGRDVAVGGNLGPPALDLLREPQPELFVLELSSFQLETTFSLDAVVAVVLNVSDDHLDRHASLGEYAAIKRRVYGGRGTMVINADDAVVAGMAEPGRRVIRFGLGAACGEDFGLIERAGGTWIGQGGEPWLALEEVPLIGRANHANVLAALALGHAAGLPQEAMVRAVRHFQGLPHRCQRVRTLAGVTWYNDSKGTNVGAALAALQGVPGERVVLIAGGDGKGADFRPLRETVAARARAVVLIGRDAALIERALGGVVPVVHARSMQEAVREAAALARSGDSVLLSPACASFDMFTHYVARGEAFVAAVEGLAQ